MLRYLGLAVDDYGYALKCLANEKLRDVKHPGYRALKNVPFCLPLQQGSGCPGLAEFEILALPNRLIF